MQIELRELRLLAVVYTARVAYRQCPIRHTSRSLPIDQLTMAYVVQHQVERRVIY